MSKREQSPLLTINCLSFVFSYIAVVFDAVLPEISHGELWSDDNSGSEDHHEANTDNSPGGMVERQWIIEN